MPDSNDRQSNRPAPNFIRKITPPRPRNDLLPHTVPTFNDVDAPTADELWVEAIFHNYRALVDTSPGGGFDVLYGPTRGPDGKPVPIPGTEYLAVGTDPRPQTDLGPAAKSGNFITFVVQIPTSFNADDPRILVAPSPGSRGVYGAVCVGEWGLKNNFAVVYTDKGTGIGLHDLEHDDVVAADGTKIAARDPLVQTDGAFVALSGLALAKFNATKPHRFAIKHAHSQAHPEQAWGQYVAMAVELALYVLNENHLRTDQKPFTPENTKIIASSLSNGGAACLQAGEQFPGLIHGIVVAEPNINPVPDRSVAIRQGNTMPLTDHSRSLLDYTTLINIYQGCVTTPGGGATARARCKQLVKNGMLSGTTLGVMARNAQAEINRYGILPEQNEVQTAYWNFSTTQMVSLIFSSAYGRLSVDDPALGYSIASVDAANAPIGAPARSITHAFALSNGLVPDSLTTMLINDRSAIHPKPAAGPQEESREDIASVSSNGSQDANLDGALRLRSLFLGYDAVTRAALAPADHALHEEISRSIKAVQASGDLHGIPTVIVHGRADAIIAPNHTSRPYYAQVLKNGGISTDNVRYYEVTNATHIDSLIGLVPGFNENYVPLHYYLIQGLDLMWKHLRSGLPSLPPSQVIDTVPRRAATAPRQPLVGITANNVGTILPPITPLPEPKWLITFQNNVLSIPD